MTVMLAFVQMALVGLTLDAIRTMGEQPNGQPSHRLPLSVESVTGATVRPVRTSVQWKDREYDVDSGIPILMSVIRDPKESAHDRGWALSQLAMLTTQLKGRPCLDELAKLYDGANEADKHGILICFLGSADPGGIPVFIRTLDEETNMHLRLSAAAGLAQWNIHRGVAELVKMLDSTETFPPPTGMLPYVRDSALNLFRVKNIHKGWGFPDDEESALAPPDVMPPPEVVARLKPPPTVAEIKKWFAENQHRFPEWKPGDPLPELKPGAAPENEHATPP